MAANILSTIVDTINEKLRSQGKEAVQEVKMTNKEGKVIGQVRYGYKPQYIFDAINAVLLPENWRYECLSKEIFNQQAVVEVKLFIRIEDEWICKGSQCGQMMIVKDNVGDAYKGAITDAIQKNFAVLSIGTDSYRGLLEKVYKGSSQSKAAAVTSRPPGQAASTQQTIAAQSSKSQAISNQSIQNNKLLKDKEELKAAGDENERKPVENSNKPTQDSNQDPPSLLPQIAGIKFQRVDDRFIASGKVYEKKDMLKAAGFKWDSSNKNWFKSAYATLN